MTSKDNGTKNVGQQGDHEKSEEHQADRIAASRHELPFSLSPRGGAVSTQLSHPFPLACGVFFKCSDWLDPSGKWPLLAVACHEGWPTPVLKRWCQTRAAPMRLASSPNEASASSAF